MEKEPRLSDEIHTVYEGYTVRKFRSSWLKTIGTLLHPIKALKDVTDKSYADWDVFAVFQENKLFCYVVGTPQDLKDQLYFLCHNDSSMIES